MTHIKSTPACLPSRLICESSTATLRHVFVGQLLEHGFGALYGHVLFAVYEGFKD